MTIRELPHLGRPQTESALQSACRTLLGSVSNIHFPGGKPDIFIFATPRSGSTFLVELLSAQPNVKLYDEPITVNYAASRRELGVKTWEEPQDSPHF